MILLAFCLKTPAKYCPEDWCRQQVAQLLGLELLPHQVASRLALSCQQVRLSARVQEVHRLSQAVQRLDQAVRLLDQAVRLLVKAVRLLVLKATLQFRYKQAVAPLDTDSSKLTSLD